MVCLTFGKLQDMRKAIFILTAIFASCSNATNHPFTQPDCNYIIPAGCKMVHSDKTGEYTIDGFRTCLGISGFQYNSNASLVTSKDSCILKSLLHKYMDAQPEFK